MIGNGDVYDGQNQIIDGTTASDTGVANQISASLTIGNVSNCFTIVSTKIIIHMKYELCHVMIIDRMNILLQSNLLESFKAL